MKIEDSDSRAATVILALLAWVDHLGQLAANDDREVPILFTEEVPPSDRTQLIRWLVDRVGERVDSSVASVVLGCDLDDAEEAILEAARQIQEESRLASLETDSPLDREADGNR